MFLPYMQAYEIQGFIVETFLGSHGCTQLWVNFHFPVQKIIYMYDSNACFLYRLDFPKPED